MCLMWSMHLPMNTCKHIVWQAGTLSGNVLNTKTSCTGQFANVLKSNTPSYVGEYNLSSTLLPTDRKAHLSFPWTTSSYTLAHRVWKNIISAPCVGRGAILSKQCFLFITSLLIKYCLDSHSGTWNLFSEEMMMHNSCAYFGKYEIIFEAKNLLHWCSFLYTHGFLDVIIMFWE